MTRRVSLSALAAALWLAVFPSHALAQSAIAGVVKDASGAVLPGVTVEASSDVLIEKTRSVVTNGIRLFCVEDGPPSGPLVLFVHGWPEFWWSWRHQLPALAGAGYHAVALDLPGYGRSDKPDVTYDEEWVNTTIAGLVPALGHERAVVVGHDWGGLLVWPFARRFPGRTAIVGDKKRAIGRFHKRVNALGIRRCDGHRKAPVWFLREAPIGFRCSFRPSIAGICRTK